MSTKLNAEELADDRFHRHYSVAEALAYNPGVEMAPRRIATEVYAAAIREVAQPIADERDELRAICEALISAHDWAIANQDSPVSAVINYGHVAHDARAILAKYPKP